MRALPWFLVATLSLAGSSGCKKKVDLGPVALEEDALVRAMQERAIPDLTQARFSIKMRSKKLGIAAPRLGGGLFVERPDKAYVAILDPVGSPVLTLTSNGDQAVFMNMRDKQYVAQDGAAEALHVASEGFVQLDDVVALLLGRLPLDDAHISEKISTAEGTAFTFSYPGDVTLRATVDPVLGTPIRVEVDDQTRDQTIIANYDPFEQADGYWLPTRMELLVPGADLTLDLNFKTWKEIEQAPDLFSPEAPDGFEVISFDTFIERMGDAVKGIGGGDATED